MKKLLISAIAALVTLAAIIPVAQAAATANFNVVINLTSACQITTAPGDITFNYTSLQGSAATPTSSYAVTCTNLLPYTMSVSGASVTDDAVNLAYDLTLSATVGVGSGASQPYTVNGNMAAGQAGTCATASCTNALATNKTKTLTITY